MEEKKIDAAQTYNPPIEVGNQENYSGSGNRNWNPFNSFHLLVDHQPSSFAPDSKWSNKGACLEALQSHSKSLLLLVILTVGRS